MSKLQYKKIETEEEYKYYLERFEEVFQAEIGTPESEEANILSIMITEWEENIIE